MRRLLQLTLFCLLAITTVIQTFAADPLTVSMGKTSWPKETTYSATKTSNDGKWTFSNFGNNDNSWDYVRIGKKKSTTTSTLTSIEPIAENIESASFNIKAWLRGEITAIKVQVCPDSKFGESNTKTYSLSIMPTKAGGPGEISIPIEKPVANQYYKINITCNNATKDNGVIDIDWFKFYPVESSDTRQDVTLAWSESAVSTNIGETFTAPTLTVNPADATSSLVYSSSDTSVAEIATNGTVTIKIKAVGQTTITAAIPDEDPTYKPISASYTLTVIDPNEVYYLVKTKGDFDVTQECILVAYNNNKDSYQAAMGKQIKTNKNAYYREAVPYSQIATSLPDQLNAPDGTVPFILEPNDNATAYYIKVGENKYISVNKDGTDTKEEAKSSASTVNLNINGTDHKASLQASGNTITRALGYNNSANPKRFASYTAEDATYNKVYLYQKRSATPALGDIKFSPASGSTVDEGTEITISAQNATSLAYSIKTGDVWSESVMITGNSVNVPVSEDCTISVIAKNDETHEQKSAEATYTVVHPVTYELVEAYNGNDIPDGNYIFASTTANGSFMMKGQEKDYRIADDVTITDNKFGAYPRFEITVKKEDNGYYSLSTKEGNYIYATAEKKVAETTETNKDEGKGKWQPEISGSTMKLKWVNGEQNFGYFVMNKTAKQERFTTYNSDQAPISLYTVQTTKCGTVIFNPAPGSEVPINSTVKISCKNATQISYSITKNEVPSTTVVVPGSVAEVTITEDCIIEAYGTNDEGDSEIADAIYTVQEPFTLYTDFYEETDAPYIPDGNYVLVGSVSTGESAGEYYMAEQKDDYRVANKIQPLEDGRLPIDNKYQINIKKEDSGNYSLTTADRKYLYAVYSTTTSGEGESQTTTTTYSVKEGEAADGQGKWKANIKNGKVYFSWAEPSYGDFKFNPQSPRFKTYDPASNSMVSFSLYSTNIPLCRDLKFDHADGSSVVRGSTVTISCINAAKIFYAVGSGKDVTVEGNKASVIISDDCTITAYAENAAGVPTGDAISASYTVTDPYVEFAGYGSDGSIPDGEYIFVGKTGTNGDLRYMAEQATTSDNITYRKAVLVTPFVDGRIGVSDKHAITVKKEEGANYSLITADSKYLYANSSTSTTGVGESQVTTTNYSVVEGDKTAGEGKWKASVDINNGTVEFVWNDDASTLRYYASGEYSRFKPYKNEAPITGTKFYLYAPTPKPAQVVCTGATIINKEIKISVNKTITFHSEGAGKMACEILEEDEERNSVETFDIVDGDTYVFTTSPKATYQVVNIIPYDQYGAAHTPSSLCVGVTTFNLPKISYHFVDGEDKAAFYAENGIITEIRPYRIDGTLEETGTYPDNVIPFRFSQPRFKVTAQNEIGDVVEESFSFIQELCNRNNIEGGAYSVVINYKDANSTEVASFPIEETELGSLNWTMDGYLVNESDDILKTYPFLIKESYITLHIAPYRADSPTILNVKIAAPADGGEGVYGAPAHAPATGDLVATVGNFNFVQNGGSHFYFDGQGKNFIKGNIEVSPFEYANIRITSIDDVTTEVSDILDDDTEEVFYNLQGVRVENPDKGIYIRVKGNKTEKILK